MRGNFTDVWTTLFRPYFVVISVLGWMIPEGPRSDKSSLKSQASAWLAEISQTSHTPLNWYTWQFSFSHARTDVLKHGSVILSSVSYSLSSSLRLFHWEEMFPQKCCAFLTWNFSNESCHFRFSHNQRALCSEGCRIKCRYQQREQLVNVATSAQYACPVRPGQFLVRGLWTGWYHCSTWAASNQRSDLWVLPSGSTSVTGTRRPRAYLASTNCHRVTTREKTAFVLCAAVHRGPENSQLGPEHPKRFVEPGSQCFLLWSCARRDWQAHYLVDLREWPLASRWDGSVA